MGEGGEAGKGRDEGGAGGEEHRGCGRGGRGQCLCQDGIHIVK